MGVVALQLQFFEKTSHTAVRHFQLEHRSTESDKRLHLALHELRTTNYYLDHNYE